VPIRSRKAGPAFIKKAKPAFNRQLLK
jgi:hypothetical protein